MDRRYLSFLAVADELHFGRAAQRLKLLPAVISRDVALLEDEIGIRLFNRTTRSVSLTRAGEAFLVDARALVALMGSAYERARAVASTEGRRLRVGAIDSAATGLMPRLVRDFNAIHPDIEVIIVEDKTIKLLPRLVSGALDLAFVRPPPGGYENVRFEFLLHEAVVVALPEGHALAMEAAIEVRDLIGVPLIVPSARNRPHSHHLTHRLFEEIGAKPSLAQHADEKHTIVHLVGAGVGAAIVPHWTTRLHVEGVVYRPLLTHDRAPIRELPLAAARAAGMTDPAGEAMIALVIKKLDSYAT